MLKYRSRQLTIRPINTIDRILGYLYIIITFNILLNLPIESQKWNGTDGNVFLLAVVNCFMMHLNCNQNRRFLSSYLSLS